MPTKKSPKTTPRRGPATNLRPAGPHEDKREKLRDKQVKLCCVYHRDGVCDWDLAEQHWGE